MAAKVGYTGMQRTGRLKQQQRKRTAAPGHEARTTRGLREGAPLGEVRLVQSACDGEGQRVARRAVIDEVFV